MTSALTLVELKPNYDAMLAHLRHLFGGDLGKYADGLIEIAWTSVKDGVHKLSRAQLYRVDELELAATHAHQKSLDGFNVYVGVALRKPGTPPFARASDKDCYCVTSVCIDLDKEQRAQNAKNVWKDMPPTLCAMTGMHPHARMQCFWKLYAPLSDFEEYTRLQIALASAFDGDPTIVNPSRVMRLAGSIAWPAKPGRVQELTYIQPLKNQGSEISVEDVVERFGQFIPRFDLRPGALNDVPRSELTKYAPMSTASPVGSLGIGPITDGRDAYMRDTVLACLKQYIGENGCAPGHVELFELAWPQYERNAVVNIPGKITRGQDEMNTKVKSALARFHAGQISSMRTLDEAIASYRADNPPAVIRNPQTAYSGDFFPSVGAIDPTKIERRHFLYGGHYIRKYASATIATGGTGKSSLILVEALAMATGRALLGIKPAHRCRVAIWNGEDPLDEIHRRLGAAIKKYTLKPEDYDGYLFAQSGRQKQIQLASVVNKMGATVDEETLQAIVAELKAKQLDVLIVDPFVSSHRVPENDNNAVDAVVKAWARIAELANCAIELVHHSRKTRGEEVDVEDSRGASALLAAVRSARAINTMTEDEAKSAGVDLKHYRRFFKSLNGKSNMGPPPEKADWFQLIPVELGNGDGLHPSDYVAVVEAWTWPELLAGITPQHAEKVFEQVRRGKWRDNSQAGDWVGHAVALGLGLKLTNDRDKAIVKRWLREALAAGTLVKVEGRDDRRMKKVFVVVRDDA